MNVFEIIKKFESSNPPNLSISLTYKAKKMAQKVAHRYNALSLLGAYVSDWGNEDTHALGQSLNATFPKTLPDYVTTICPSCEFKNTPLYIKCAKCNIKRPTSEFEKARPNDYIFPWDNMTPELRCIERKKQDKKIQELEKRIKEDAEIREKQRIFKKKAEKYYLDKITINAIGDNPLAPTEEQWEQAKIAHYFDDNNCKL